MDKITKFLKKLTPTELDSTLDLLEKIKKREIIGLNIKKLKGYESIFRARKGSIRILYRADAKGDYHLLDIRRKNEKTYKF